MYHLFTQILQPYTLLVLGLVGAAGWYWWRKNSRRRALILAGILVGLLFGLSTPIAGFLALRSLERNYLSAAVLPRPNDTLVVLSGSLLHDDEAGTQVRVGPDTIYRCYHAVKLYKQAGRCRILLSGGKVDFSEPGPTLAKAMHDFVVEFGVQSDDVLLEEQSSTTWENAKFSKPLLDGKPDTRIILVTDAAHMPRAVCCFESQGLTVIPAPCNFRARRLEFSSQIFLPSPDGMDDVNYAAHEWLGLVWYRLRSLGGG
jgi:uncharacterized SAM-binding protein YcdF (DUF218 family)